MESIYQLEDFWRILAAVLPLLAKILRRTVSIYSSNILQVRFFNDFLLIFHDFSGVVGHIFSGWQECSHIYFLSAGLVLEYTPLAHRSKKLEALWMGSPMVAPVAGNSLNFTMETSSGHMIDHVFLYPVEKKTPQNEAIFQCPCFRGVLFRPEKMRTYCSSRHHSMPKKSRHVFGAPVFDS